MGLSISQSIARNHGGSLWAVANATGIGATVRLTLPIVEESTHDPSAGTRSKRVLIVDDHEGMRKALTRLIRTWGHTVAVAAEGRTALSQISGFQPDVVVLGFYANDFEDNLKAGLFALDSQNELKEQKYEHIPGVRIQNVIYSVPPVRWLSENSYLYSLVFNGVWNYFKQNLRDSAVHGAHASELEYAVPTGNGPSEAQVMLAARLIERMHRFCSDRGIRLMVVDIPRRTGAHDYSSSFPPALRMRLELAGIEVLESESLLAPFRGIAQFHKPHGHQHISEFTHVLIGAEIGRRLAGQPVAVTHR